MMRVLGDRVLVALPPEPEERTTESGIVLIRDPDILRTPTQGIVVALGEKSGTVDLDELRAAVAEALDQGFDWVTRDALTRLIASLAPAGFDVAVGDCVCFDVSAGDEFEDHGVRYVVLREAEIIGVVTPLRAMDDEGLHPCGAVSQAD